MFRIARDEKGIVVVKQIWASLKFCNTVLATLCCILLIVDTRNTRRRSKVCYTYLQMVHWRLKWHSEVRAQTSGRWICSSSGTKASVIDRVELGFITRICIIFLNRCDINHPISNSRLCLHLLST